MDAIKKKLGAKAAELIENNMTVGLGTGTTAFYFIQALGARCRQGLAIRAVASSQASLAQAQKEGIPLVDIDTITHIDITVDGADQIDDKKRMIKGGGGALVREKIVAAMSQEMVVIVDETKLAPLLGAKKLPVEIIPFATLATQRHIEKYGLLGTYRPTLTDNHNRIFDIELPSPLNNPEALHDKLIHIPGVVDTGFFFNLAGRVLIGFSDGQIVTHN